MRLTRDGRFKFAPVFLKGGEVVYTELAKPELMRLVRLRDGKAEPLHKEASRSELEAAFSADGKFCAFLRARAAGTIDLVLRDAATVEKELPSESASGPRSPAVAPDGSRVLFAFAEGSRQELYSVSRRGSGRKKVVGGDGVHNWPCWSPDGKRIAFSSTRDGNYEVYAADADGGNLRRLTNSPRQDVRPRFSPDGKRIAFTSHRDGNAEVYVMNADGTGLRRVTDHTDRDDYPAWHPDGRRIVFVSDRDGGHDLYMIDAPR